MQFDLGDSDFVKVESNLRKRAIRDSKLVLFLTIVFLAFSCTQNEAQPLKQKNLKNATMKNYRLLDCMYSDAYFPTKEVDKGKKILVELCWKIESKAPKNLEELYTLTQQATIQFNKLAADFEVAGSEIETGARECIGENFLFIAKAYGFNNADAEELIGTRDW